jgi:hypothetical protein
VTELSLAALDHGDDRALVPTRCGALFAFQSLLEGKEWSKPSPTSLRERLLVEDHGSDPLASRANSKWAIRSRA